MRNENVEKPTYSLVMDDPSSRLCASGEQEEPLQGSFLLGFELLPATRLFWFSLTGCLWCQQLMSPCLRELFNRSRVPYSASSLPVLIIAVSSHRSAVRALNKNFSIAFFFPAFITLLFFQHNRTVYDMVAGTIVVKRSRFR